MNPISWLGLVNFFRTPARSSRRTQTTRRCELRVEALEERALPSATMLDLTTRGASGTIDGARYEQFSVQPAGTGVIRSFLRVQGNGVEQGYNTDARPLEFDEKSSAQFTRSIRVSDLPATSVDGVTYRVMLLDINESNSQPNLSLDELRIYVADSANLTGYNATTKQLGGHTAVFDQSASGPTVVQLNAGLNPGSGIGDMLLFVPESVLASADPDPFVYVYSKFGATFAASGGFEEWAPATGLVPPVTSPPAILSGFVYVDDNRNGLRDADEPGIAGVLLTLTSTNSMGQVVTQSVTTGEDGSYAFVGLLPGLYSVSESQPVGYIQGENSVGTVNGAVQGSDLGDDMLGDIFLQSGQLGIEYNFGERLFFGGDF